ncbi:hypothetical protein ABMA10_18640 [Plantibacter sp. RU18]
MLQAGTQALLEPLFHQSTVAGAERAATRIGSLIGRMVRDASDGLPDQARLIVHNVARPSFWPPIGSSQDWRHIWENLNRPIEEAVREHGALLFDEIELAARHGASNLFDDVHFPWSHHGGATDLQNDAPNQRAEVHIALARELWQVILSVKAPSVKVIVADLDGTLWPGVLAELGPGVLDADTNSVWVHQGIQEALKTYERQGIVLASLSKGDEAVTLDLWQAAGSRSRLRPEDFAAHSIDWTPKPQRMASLLDSLQTTEDRVIFIDDHPAERALMQRAFPQMLVLGESIESVRSMLLGSFPLRRGASGVTGSRTSTTRAALDREKDRMLVPEDDFEEFLQIRRTVRSATTDDYPRIIELLDRTTQFSLANPNSTLRSNEVFADGASVMVLEVEDRYTDYGLVGVSIIENGALPTLRAYSVSCRVLGLDVSDSLLREHMDALGASTLRVALVETDRNRVIRQALTAWNLVRDPAGHFTINRKDQIVEMDNAS